MESKQENIAYIGFGSNKGDRLKFIRDAAYEINNDVKSRIVKTSSIYETKPFGHKDQSDFLNAVAKIETGLSFRDLFELIKQIEQKLGRQKTYKWGPREIDLDMLFYNDLVFSDEKLTIPHPGVPERDFVITPLIEIEPDLFHPVLKQKISDICISESAKNIIRITDQQIL